jgi:GNAT superfamily N-acetyltransferase
MTIRELEHAETARAFAAMRALRQHLADEDELVRRVGEQRAEGYRLVAAVEDDGSVSTVAGFRVRDTLADGRILYVDDLSTLPAARRRGYGRALLDWCAAEGRRLGCKELHLDSSVGADRQDAHRLYFNAGMRIGAYHFERVL